MPAQTVHQVTIMYRNLQHAVCIVFLSIEYARYRASKQSKCSSFPMLIMMMIMFKSRRLCYLPFSSIINSESASVLLQTVNLSHFIISPRHKTPRAHRSDESVAVQGSVNPFQSIREAQSGCEKDREEDRPKSRRKSKKFGIGGRYRRSSVVVVVVYTPTTLPLADPLRSQFPSPSVALYLYPQGRAHLVNERRVAVKVGSRS
jgi:hypothetical protein